MYYCNYVLTKSSRNVNKFFTSHNRPPAWKDKPTGPFSYTAPLLSARVANTLVPVLILSETDWGHRPKCAPLHFRLLSNTPDCYRLNFSFKHTPTKPYASTTPHKQKKTEQGSSRGVVGSSPNSAMTSAARLKRLKRFKNEDHRGLVVVYIRSLQFHHTGRDASK